MRPRIGLSPPPRLADGGPQGFCCPMRVSALVPFGPTPAACRRRPFGRRILRVCAVPPHSPLRAFELRPMRRAGAQTRDDPRGLSQKFRYRIIFLAKTRIRAIFEDGRGSRRSARATGGKRRSSGLETSYAFWTNHARSETGSDFFISFGCNPLKSPDSEK